MANTTISSNMSLPVPVVGQESGPQYAIDIDACLAIIDSHDHSAGSGVQVTPAGLNISSDLSIGSNNLTSVRSTRMTAQNSPITATTPDLGCTYVSGVDLYYNDVNGNQIQITQNGGIAGSPGSISNLVAPASASYVSADGTFVWQSDASTAANMDMASIILRNMTANSKGLTISPPNAMGADYSIVMPSLPNATKILNLDTSGNISASYSVDASTIVINSNILSVAASALVDDVSIKQTANVMSAKNTTFTQEFRLNGNYGSLTLPCLGPDGMAFFSYNATIINVWAYIRGPGSSGTTQIDLKVASGPGIAFATLFTTKPAFTSAAAAYAYVDMLGTAAPGTGVTAPVLTTTSIAAGSALRMDITSSMVNPDSVGLIIQWKQR